MQEEQINFQEHKDSNKNKIAIERKDNEIFQTTNMNILER